MEYQTSSSSPSRKRHRSGKHDDVDKGLCEWFVDARASNIPVSGLILLNKANDLAKKLGDSDFSASSGWVDRFKIRHNIVSKVFTGENAAVDRNITDEWKNNTLPSITKGFTPNNIFNADETGLFYKLIPSRSLNVKGESCSGTKKPKDRLTFLIACNMDGSEKLKLQVIGKFQSPRCFKGIKSLPVDYHANRRAWMTSEIFRMWVMKLDKKFAAQKRKVLLTVDNCAAHPKLTGLRSITLAFFPPNTTSVLQPCDQGIIQNFKVKYRQRMVQHIIDSYDQKKDPAINILMAIRHAFSAWQAVSTQVIRKCFTHSGFCFDENEFEDDDVPLAQLISDMEDEIPLVLLRMTTKTEVSFKQLEEADMSLSTTEQRTDDEIVSVIKDNKGEDDEVDAEEDYEEDMDIRPIVSKCEAVECIEKLKQYIEQLQDAEENHFISLDVLENKIHSSKQSQSKISDFFKTV